MLHGDRNEPAARGYGPPKETTTETFRQRARTRQEKYLDSWEERDIGSFSHPRPTDEEAVPAARLRARRHKGFPLVWTGGHPDASLA